jgi:cation transporter-like permease
LHWYRQALAQKQQSLLGVILRKSSSLFLTEYRGLTVLVPSFMYAIGRVILGKNATTSSATSAVLDETNTPVVILRRACIKILATLVCLPNHYPGIKFQSLVPEKPAKLPVLISFDDVCPMSIK